MMAFNIFSIVLLLCMCYVSAHRRPYVTPKKDCVKEKDMEEFLKNWCEHEPLNDPEAMQNFYTEDAIFQMKDLPPTPLKGNVEIIMSFKKAFLEYFNIKNCEDSNGKPKFLGCEHKTIPSVANGDTKVTTVDKKYTAEGTYSLEFVYVNDKVKISKTTCNLNLDPKILKELKKKVHLENSVDEALGVEMKKELEKFESSDYSDEPLETSATEDHEGPKAQKYDDGQSKESTPKMDHEYSDEGIIEETTTTEAVKGNEQIEDGGDDEAVKEQVSDD